MLAEVAGTHSTLRRNIDNLTDKAHRQEQQVRHLVVTGTSKELPELFFVFGSADRSLLQPLHQQHQCKAHTCAQHTPSPQRACPVSTPCCGPPCEPCHALPAW